jgi:hypothetical protein
MTQERLQEYPLIVESELDFEATRDNFGIGSCNLGISETLLSNGETAVYLHQQRESPRVVSTSAGFRNICEQGIVVCGYKVNPTGIFKSLKSPKIRVIPDSEIPRVKSELMEKLKGKEPAYVNFWI